MPIHSALTWPTRDRPCRQMSFSCLPVPLCRGASWLFFQLLVAQGAAAGQGDAQVFSSLWVPTAEDIATEDVSDAVVVLQSEDYVASAPETLPKYRGAAELFTDTGPFKHCNQDGLISCLLQSEIGLDIEHIRDIQVTAGVEIPNLQQCSTPCDSMNP